MRIIFLGTPAFAVPTLKRLLSWDKGKVLAVVTQPDRAVGRKSAVQPSPVKLAAQAASILVLQPDKLSKSSEIIEQMRLLQPDILVMVAFGQILREPVLKLAPCGVLNLHGSLLPKYRGAAPINWAIINGETVTGVTTIFCDQGIDSGKMLLKRQIPIGINDSALDLTNTMSIVGADVVIETLEQVHNKTIVPKEQDETAVSWAPILTKEMGNIIWTKSANEIYNLVRGLLPWPGTYSRFNDITIKIIRTAIPEELNLNNSILPSKWAPGLFLKIQDRFFVNCGYEVDLLEILEVQPANRALMTSLSWVNGFADKSSVIYGIFDT